MGFSDSFIAVKGCAREAVLDHLEADLGETQDLPGAFSLVELPGGWTAVVHRGADAAFKPPLAGLAALGPAVACGIDEHVMYSEARGYENGAEVWTVIWDNAEGWEDGPRSSGSPPPQYAGLLKDALAQQKAEDENEEEDMPVDLLFDVPPDLAHSVCGLRVDADLPEGARVFALRKRRKPGLFSRLFGRG